MLAIREVSQESTGFSPNELVFRQTLRGPLAMLGEELKDAELPDNVLNYVNYVCRWLYVACATAHKSLAVHRKKMKALFDGKVKTRLFEPGDHVLALPVVGSHSRQSLVGLQLKGVCQRGTIWYTHQTGGRIHCSFCSPCLR